MEVFPTPRSPITSTLYRCSFWRLCMPLGCSVWLVIPPVGAASSGSGELNESLRLRAPVCLCPRVGCRNHPPSREVCELLKGCPRELVTSPPLTLGRQPSLILNSSDVGVSSPGGEGHAARTVTGNYKRKNKINSLNQKTENLALKRSEENWHWKKSLSEASFQSFYTTFFTLIFSLNSFPVVGIIHPPGMTS